MRLGALSIMFALMLGQAQQPPSVDFNAIGPSVGTAAADFELPDQHGTPRTLSSLLGPKGAMLVFYRSADW